MKKKTLIVLLASGAVALAGGTAVAVADDGPGRRTSLADDDFNRRLAEAEGLRQPAKGALTVGQAIARARKAVRGTVESAELSRSVWEVDLLTPSGDWRRVLVSASGRVTKRRTGSGDSEEISSLRSARVSAARAAALAARSGSWTVTSVEFEDDDSDRPAWEVELRSKKGAEREVLVDAATGRISAARDDD